MIITEYWHVDVYSSRTLNKHWNLGADWTLFELQKSPVSHQNIKICQAITNTHFNEDSKASQFRIAEVFGLD